MSTFKFKPDKKRGNDGISSEFTNDERADRGEAMFRKHPDNTFMNIAVDDAQTGAIDALADFFHFCDRTKIDVDEAVSGALLHWRAER